MAICSYLVYAVPGQGQILAQKLAVLPAIIRTQLAQDHDVAVVVTDTPNQQSSQELLDQMGKIDELACITLVFGEVDSPVPSARNRKKKSEAEIE